jgi:GAF domain-containing protein
MTPRAYDVDLRDLRALLDGEDDPIARMATVSALLKSRDPRISWVGFYRRIGPDLLILGPFQGPVACLRIRVGQGVCGAAAAQGKPLLVEDVHAFPGHIACDPLARSELVLPVFDEGGETVLAVLDLDSYERAAFTEADRDGLMAIAGLIYGEG